MNWDLYRLAFVGAALGVMGDLAGTNAARNPFPNLVPREAFFYLSVICWMCCAYPWYQMSLLTNGGIVGPGAAWGFMASALWIGVAIFTGEKQSLTEWISFGLIVAAQVLRESSKLIEQGR